MPTTPNALFIDTDGHTTRITLPDDPDQRADTIRAITNSRSLEAVDLTDSWALWLDETGGMLGRHRRDLNPAATFVASRCGVPGGIRGPVVITGTSAMGTVLLAEDGLAAVEAVISEAAEATSTTP